MVDSATSFQRHIKQNADDLQNFLKDITSWEDDIKKKDELLCKQKPILKKSIPPVRNKGPKKDPPQAPVNGKKRAPKINSYDYQAWDKFDVEKACESDGSSDSSAEDEDAMEDEEEQMYVERNQQRAAIEKEKGNVLFSQHKFEAAVERYTQAIALDPSNTVLPANRAMALLKMDRYAAAEQDCTIALSLDHTYCKALYRRATARVKLKKYKEASQDFHDLLKLEPNNKKASIELDQVEKMIADSNIPHVTAATPTPAKEASVVYPVTRPTYMRSKKQLRTVPIEEIGSPLTKPAPPVVKSCDPEPVTMAVTHLPAVPNSSITFMHDWKRLHGNPDLLLQYFQLLPVENYPTLLSQSLETDVFPEIINLLHSSYIKKGQSCLSQLQALAKLKRFSVAVMFLSKKDKTVLQTIFSELRSVVSSEDEPVLLQLAKSYHVTL